MVVYKLLKDGAFVAGDTETRNTAYSYPGSANADEAKHASSRLVIAQKMMRFENSLKAKSMHKAEHDTKNWALLEN